MMLSQGQNLPGISGDRSNIRNDLILENVVGADFFFNEIREWNFSGLWNTPNRWNELIVRISDGLTLATIKNFFQFWC